MIPVELKERQNGLCNDPSICQIVLIIYTFTIREFAAPENYSLAFNRLGEKVIGLQTGVIKSGAHPPDRI